MSNFPKKYVLLASAILAISLLTLWLYPANSWRLGAATVTLAASTQVILAVLFMSARLTLVRSETSRSMELARSRLDWKINYEQQIVYKSLSKALATVIEAQKRANASLDERLHEAEAHVNNQVSVLSDNVLAEIEGLANDVRLAARRGAQNQVASTQQAVLTRLERTISDIRRAANCDSQLEALTSSATALENVSAELAAIRRMTVEMLAAVDTFVDIQAAHSEADPEGSPNSNADEVSP